MTQNSHSFNRLRTARALLSVLLASLLFGCGPQSSPTIKDDDSSLTVPFLPAPGMDTLAPQAAGLVVSSTPADGASGVTSSAALQLAFSSVANKTKVETAYALYPGKYDPTSTPASFTKLGLTSMCAGRLRVRNPNTFPLSFQWDAYNTPERGVGTAPASSDVFFTASPTATIRVFVGTQLQNTKAQNTTACGARDFTPTWSADAKSVSLQPTSPLTVGQDYTLTLSTLAADTTGSILAAPLAVRFDTRVSNTGGDPSQLNLGARVLPNFAGLEFTRVDGGLALEFSSSTPVWTPGSKVFSAQVTAKNSSSTSYTNVRAVLKSFAPGNVSVVSPSGFTGDDLPFLDFGALNAGESKTLSWKLYAPDGQPFAFKVSAFSLSAAQNTLILSSVAPSNFANNVTTSITLQGAGIRQETAFFIESTRLNVSSWTPTSATVSVPYGFLPGNYGIMAANPDGTRAVLYPALTIAEGPKPRAADPRERAFSFADGFVINYDTKRGIAGATITAKVVTPGGVQSISATSVSDGYYLLRGLPVGTHQVEIKAVGFEPLYRTAVITDPGDDPSRGATVHLKHAALEPSSFRVTNIGSGGGTHYASNAGENGPFLVIPPGALNQSVPIRFTHLRAAETLPELPQDGYYLAFARLEPVGLTFQKPATLYLPLQAGIQLTDGTPIKISYFDARENRWVQDITAGTIVTRANGKQYLEYEINHFTWIGGQWFPDPVSGCIKYANGQSAVGLQTNYGVTNGAGCYSGSTTRSDSGRTLTAYPVAYPSNTVTFDYNGNQPVVFPILTLPNPDPLNVVTPSSKGPCDNGLAPFSVPSPGFSAQSLPSQPALTSSTLSSQSRADFSSQSLNTTEKTLLVSSSTYGFSSQVFGGALNDPSTIRVQVDGQDVTATVNLTPVSSTYYNVDYTLDKPLKSGLGRRIEVSAGIGEEPRVKGALEADVVAGFATQPTIPVVLPDSYIPESIRTPYTVGQAGRVTVLFRQRDVVGGRLQFRIPVQALDEQGNAVALSSSSVSFSDPGLSSSATDFVAGLASVPVDIALPSQPQTLSLEGLVVNSGTSARAGQAVLRATSTDPCKKFVAKPSPLDKFVRPDAYIQGLLNYKPLPPQVLVTPALDANNPAPWAQWLYDYTAVGRVVDWSVNFGAQELEVAGRKFTVGDFLGFGIGVLPLAGDAVALGQEAFNGLTGKGVDPFIASISAASFAADISGVGAAAGAVGSGAVGIYRLSRNAGGMLATALSRTIESGGGALACAKNARACLDSIKDLLTPYLEVLATKGPVALRNIDNNLKQIASKLANFCGLTLRGELSAQALPCDPKAAATALVEMFGRIPGRGFKAVTPGSTLYDAEETAEAYKNLLNFDQGYFAGKINKIQADAEAAEIARKSGLDSIGLEQLLTNARGTHSEMIHANDLLRSSERVFESIPPRATADGPDFDAVSRSINSTITGKYYDQVKYSSNAVKFGYVDDKFGQFAQLEKFARENPNDVVRLVVMDGAENISPTVLSRMRESPVKLVDRNGQILNNP